MNSKNDSKSFKLGDMVTWETKGSGSTYVKTGEIVCLVPIGADPFSRRTSDKRFYRLPNFGPKIPCNRTVRGGGLPRVIVSYIVQSGDTFYWPRVSSLRLIGQN